MTPKLVKIYIKRDNTVRRLTSWKFILCWADHLHVTVYIRKSQKYAVKNIINIGSSKKLLHGYGIYLSLHTRYKPQKFFCGRGGCYMYMYIKNVLSCLLRMLKSLVPYFNFWKFDHGRLPHQHWRCDGALLTLSDNHQYNCTYVCVVLAEGCWSIGEEDIEYINYRVTKLIE